MKNLETIVTDLERSKKLKEIGVKQDGLFWWALYLVGSKHKVMRLDEFEDYSWQDPSAAFTAQELLDRIPKLELPLIYCDESKDPNLANRLADMLIDLVKKGDVTIEQINGEVK